MSVVRGNEVRRIAEEFPRQLRAEHGGDVRGHGGVVAVEEELEARTPFVVGGPGGVEPENLGTTADSGGRMRDVAEMLSHQRPHRFAIEAT
ncbi:hypothetical protein [Herbihabitans rhizosphaerae]|uniref:hypothetical protein n=1 Tax=Herbihabitans rhizosphaerae TaxID=1872711 RepID=UPI001F5FDE72|nr:hypothetical protein [Herbihabitans rhizosphaerae]